VGAALGLQEYVQQTKGDDSLKNLTPWSSFERLLKSIPHIDSPRIAVLGPNGRCGQGVCTVLKTLGLSYTSFPRDSSIERLEEFDIVYNCILLDEMYSKIWYSEKTPFARPTVIVDISCDYTKLNNPIQLYTKPTTWSEPVYKPNPHVSLIAIENLPSLLPFESSYHFSTSLVPILLNYPGDIWTRALDVFNLKKASHIN
jgi:saccharopine dehydrogenase (NAD+, L-lysine-forming)